MKKDPLCHRTTHTCTYTNTHTHTEDVGKAARTHSLCVSVCLLQNIYAFLPPANEVSDKVMFLHMSVILSTSWSLHDVTSCPAAWAHVPSRGSLYLVHVPFGGFLSKGGASLSRGSLSMGSLFRIGLCPGGIRLGDSLPKSEKRAVRISLE